MAIAPNTRLTFQNANSLRNDELYAELINYLDAWLNCCVLAIGQAAPTGTESDGDRYIVGTGTGLFADHDGELAIKFSGTWFFFAPPTAGVPTIKNLTDGTDWERVAGVWAEKEGGGASALADLEDVDLAGLADGNMLVWDAGASKFVPAVPGIGGGGGGGALEFIAEVAVSGSAVTDIDFTDLDLDADGIYRLEVYVVPGATGGHVTSLFYNNDTTQANYQRNSLTYIGTTADISRTSNAYIHYTDTLGGTTNPYSMGVTIRKAAGAKPLAECGPAASCDSSGNVFITSTTQRWNDTTNVTDLTLHNLVTGGFGIGTFARLYKMTTAAGGGGGGDSVANRITFSYVKPADSLVPVMTSDTAPSGTVFASSSYSITPKWKAFDGSGLAGWLSNGGGAPAHIGYEAVAPITVKSYAIMPWCEDNYPARWLLAWKLQGSDDGATWTDIDSQSLRGSTAWIIYGYRLFSCASNTTAYLHHRLLITSVSDSYVGIDELGLYDYDVTAA